MLSQPAVLELVRERMFPAWRSEKDRLDRIDLWYRWQHELPQLPRGATAELRNLLELAKTPWLNLVVTTVAQAMYVDGYRSPDARENAGPWRTWNANDMDTRQTALHRAALAYGYAYATATPGVGQDGPQSVFRGVSPRKMYAAYADPAEDDWPMYAMRVEATGSKYMIRLYDEEAVYFVSSDSAGAEFDFIEWREHNAGVCPVVRYANQLDLDGRSDGEVEPLIGVAARIDKTGYDRLLTQHFNSWKVRTIAGLAEFADNQEEANRKKLQLRQDDLLVAEDVDTKFGTLDETPLDGFIRAYESDVETLAGLAQVPATSLTGKVANLSADAIAELRAGLTQKVYERRLSFGKSHAQLLRLGAHLEGDDVAAGDIMSRVTWQDMQVQSMSQAVDALGKAATMLGVPVEELWARIPGVTKSDVDEWKRQAARGQSRDALSALAAAAVAARTNPTVATLASRGNASAG